MLDKYRQIQQGSRQYIRDNESEVLRANQKTIILLNTFYTVSVFIFWIASLTIFKDWNVTPLYSAMLMIQLVVMVLVLARFKNTLRAKREVMGSCALFQLYVMAFVGIMSIVPVEKNQTAVYIAPVAMSISAAIVLTYYQSIFLLAVEITVYLAFASMYKQPETFAVDLCSCILTFFMAIFLNRILYEQRIRENEARQHIKRMGMMDSLTGVYNKASTAFLGKNCIKAEPNKDFVYMILDFDDFKQVNDTYGHQAGDVALHDFGMILKHVAGDQHIAGRIGGDEFCLFLKHTKKAEAEFIARTIIQRMESLTAVDGTHPFSCSIGIACYAPDEDKNASEHYKDMYQRADAQLYMVKKNGKHGYSSEG